METFDDIQIEDTAGYAAYCAELEYQEYLESPEFIDDINKELQILASEQKDVDFIV